MYASMYVVLLYLMCFIFFFQVRLFDFTSSGFTFTRALHRQESRVLCLAWHKSAEYIVMGGMDSSLRILHVSSATCTKRITLDDYKEKTTILWDVKFLGDSFIVTGSSLGKIQVWDFKHGTLCTTFAQHSADVLSLAAWEHNGNSMFFGSGVDSVIVKVSNLVSEGSEDLNKKLILSGKIRAHQHDVFSMHMSPNGFLASGGVEGDLVITDATQFCETSYVKYQPFPCMGQHFKLAKNGNLLLFQDISSLSLWSISEGASAHFAVSECSSESKRSKLELNSQSLHTTSSDEEKFTPLRLLELNCKPPHNILSSALSYDGSYIALSNVCELWIYYFNHCKHQLLLVAKLPHPAHAMQFLPNQYQLILATTSKELISIKLDKDDEVYLDTVLKDTIIKHFEVSHDGQYLALVTKRWRIHVFDLMTGSLVAKLPKFSSLPFVMTFNPSVPELVMFAGGDIRDLFTYDVANDNMQCLGKVRRGTKNEVYQGRIKLSHPLAIVPISFEENLYCIYDNDCVMLFRLKSNSVLNSTVSKVKSAKRQRDDKSNFPVQLIKSSALVLFIGTLCCTHKSGATEAKDESKGLVLVERCQKALLRSLPPTLYRKRFGT